MVDNRRISKVELYQVVISFPAFVPESVVIVGIAVEGQMKPVLKG